MTLEEADEEVSIFWGVYDAVLLRSLCLIFLSYIGYRQNCSFCKLDQMFACEMKRIIICKLQHQSSIGLVD